MTPSTSKSRENILIFEAEAKLAARSLAEALKSFDAAEAAGEDADRCAGGRWSASMLRGDFEAAWRENDSIRRRGAPDPHRFWRGEPLEGQRVIVRCLHGFGDAVQFLRYLPRLRALAASVVLEVPPRLVGLARWFAGADEVITWGKDAPAVPVEWTVQIEVMELPYIFRTQVQDLPIACNYLQLTPAPTPGHGMLRVGVMRTAGAWNPSRSVPWTCVHAILAVPGCEFWDLCDAESESHRMFQVDPHCRTSIEGLAARIATLDLVITADTLAAHIAGALGVQAWVMLQYEADWRWMHGRDESPWYPTLRLFRQAAPGDWESVERAVTQALEQQIADRERHAA